MATVEGKCDSRFNEVKELLRQNVESEEELGASICVNIDGEDVVDMWAGYTDAQRTKPWTKHTLTAVWSITKCITNMAALMLVDRGLLDPYEKVAKYWPEFAANGKENIEVRHILSHTSGVPAWDGPITIEEIYDVPKATEKLASQAPWWTPGTASGYHLVSQGHLVGELIRRVTGKSLKEFIATEIAEPLGADFHLGANEEEWSRIAELITVPSLPVAPNSDPQSVTVRAQNGSPVKAEYAMTPAFRETQLGASNGFGNARSVARMVSAISLGGSVDDTKLLSPKTIDLIFDEQANGTDLVIGAPLRFGIGFALAGSASRGSWIPEGRICWWAGWGGSVVVMDVEKRMTACYAMNKMDPKSAASKKTSAYMAAIFKAVGR